MKEGKFGKILGIITRIAFYVLSFMTIYFVILKLTNHSPTLDAVMATFIGTSLIFIFGISKRLAAVEVEIKHIKRQLNAMAIDLRKVLEIVNK